MERLAGIATLAAFAFCAAFPPASAQQVKPSANSQIRSGQPPLATAKPSAPARPEMPDAYKLNMMIRSAVIALNHANKTGNYTVLQDLAAPSFRASNNSARLAQIFAKLRQRDLDLTPILFFTPKLLQQPQILPNGILRLTGYFPTRPERVNFQLYYQMVDEEWRIFGIGVTTSRTDVTAAITPQTQNGTHPTKQPPGGTKKPTPGKSETRGAKPAPKKQPPHAATRPVKAPPPARKPQAPADVQPTDTGSAVQNETTNNATRIDLSQKAKPANTAAEIQQNGPAYGDTGNREDGSFWNSFNPFSE